MSTNAEHLGLFVEHLAEAQSALFGCIRTLMGGAPEVMDVLQETNRVLWEKAAEYDASRPFLPWAYRIAQFQVLAHRKRRSRERLVFDTDLTGQLAQEFAQQSPSSGSALRALAQCLDLLPESHRELLQARYERGEAVNEIAANAGRPVNNVSGMLYRIRNGLAECIARTMATEELA